MLDAPATIETSGGAKSTGEQGLWDAAIRTRRLDGDGVAAEVVYAQGRRCYDLDPEHLRPIAERIGPTLRDIMTPIDVLPGKGPGEAPVRSWAFRRHGAWH